MLGGYLARSRLQGQSRGRYGALDFLGHSQVSLPGQGHRPVPGLLEPTQDQETQEVADVEAVGRGVAPVVEGDRSLGESGGEAFSVGAVLHQATGLEVVEHGRVGHTAIVTRRTAAGQTRKPLPSRSFRAGGSRWTVGEVGS